MVTTAPATQSTETLVYTALPHESAVRRASWETTCRSVSLKGLHRHARRLTGRPVCLRAVVDFVFDEPDGSYFTFFPHMHPTTWLAVSTRREWSAKPGQVVIAFSRHARRIAKGDTITVWGSFEGRVTMTLTDGTHLTVPWVKARYVVGRS